MFAAAVAPASRPTIHTRRHMLAKEAACRRTAAVDAACFRSRASPLAPTSQHCSYRLKTNSQQNDMAPGPRPGSDVATAQRPFAAVFFDNALDTAEDVMRHARRAVMTKPLTTAKDRMVRKQGTNAALAAPVSPFPVAHSVRRASQRLKDSSCR